MSITSVDGYLFGAPSGLNRKIVAVTLLVLTSFAAVFTPLELSFAQANIGVYIYQVTPDTLTGPVGTSVNILGSIYSPNSSYQLVLGKNVVTSGTSEGYYVDANFTVPELPNGAYALILRDVAININYSAQFTVTSGYAINAVPSSLQEGGSLKLNVTVTGGKLSTSYNAKITVELPSPLGTKYSKMVTLGTPNAKGTASAQVTFPDSSFLPAGSLTDYAGTYKVYFNESESLAQSQFTVNFIDSTTYHRGRTVTVKATGYQPNQDATLTITSVSTGSTLGTASVTASADGVISTTWVVSSVAAIGDYKVQIAPQGTAKLIQDSETFTVPGYAVRVQAVNLAGKVASGIVVQDRDQSSNTVSTSTSGSDGIANLKLEAGNHVLTAFWNDVNVGETNITVTGEATFSILCQLTDLKVTVKDTNGGAMPFVDLNIIYQYHPTVSTSKTGSASGQTDLSGSYILTSTLTQATYTINASMYNQVFNLGNNTFSNLPARATSEVIIICPRENITINVVGYNQEVIPNARIELVELTNGLFYAATTDSNGAVTSQVTFGMYRTRVYKDNILINQTNVQAFSESQQQIRCTLYGIQVSVSVVDFFGQPIPNANVTLNGPEKLSAMTQNDGIAAFSGIIGGNMQIIALVPGTQNGYQAVVLTVDQPTSVQIKIDKYVALGPFLIQVSSLFTTAIILVAILLFALVEIYRRRRVKHISAS
jgi:hypothetical protein